MRWLLYGANGYTGELIAREAVLRGHRPILAGRNADAIEPLARELACESRVFDLADAAKHLDGVSIVLHCAGPFVHTSKPMVDACLAAGAHYLDITGEIDVFEAIFARHDEARRRGVTLIPGIGFDVVPTDCLAAMLAYRLPDANELLLAFHPTGTSLSRGTTKTMLEGLGRGGAVRRDAKIEKVGMLHDVREIRFKSRPRMAMSIPWGDVSTAFHSTGIPNITVYTSASPRAIRRVRLMRPILPILALAPIKRTLQKIADRRSGPTAAMRSSGRMELWGEVRNRAGQSVTMTMSTPEGYAFTTLSSLAAIERLSAAELRPGAFTPSRFFGEDFVRAISGVVVD